MCTLYGVLDPTVELCVLYFGMVRCNAPFWRRTLLAAVLRTWVAAAGPSYSDASPLRIQSHEPEKGHCV